MGFDYLTLLKSAVAILMYSSSECALLFINLPLLKHARISHDILQDGFQYILDGRKCRRDGISELLVFVGIPYERVVSAFRLVGDRNRVSFDVNVRTNDRYIFRGGVDTAFSSYDRSSDDNERVVFAHFYLICFKSKVKVCVNKLRVSQLDKSVDCSIQRASRRPFCGGGSVLCLCFSVCTRNHQEIQEVKRGENFRKFTY